jgi:hypothetical protein
MDAARDKQGMGCALDEGLAVQQKSGLQSAKP